MRTTLTVHEARCHLSIIELVDAVLAHPRGSSERHRHEWNLYNESEVLMRDFRPRCNCGAVLRFSNWVDKRRFVRCPSCQANWKECL